MKINSRLRTLVQKNREAVADWSHKIVGNRTESPRPPRFAIVLLLAIVMPINSCSLSSAPIVTKEVSIQGLKSYMHPKLIKVFPNGDLLVGGGFFPWAARLSAEGSLRWLWEDNPGAERGSQFEDAAILPDGKIFLCGTVVGPHSVNGLIVILGANGQVVDRRITTSPPDTPVSRLHSCTALSNGVAVSGEVVAPFTGWLMMLDFSGKQQWDLHTPPLSGFARGVLENSDHSITVLEFLNGDSHNLGVSTLERVGLDGKIQNSVSTSGNEPTLLIGAHSSRVSILASHGYRKLMISTYDDKLNVVGRSQTLGGDFETDILGGGRSYVLADGTLALFGEGNDYTAAIAHKGAFGDARVTLIGPPEISHAIEDAAPVSPTQFVTIRLSVGGHPPKATVDLAWVEFRNS